MKKNSKKRVMILTAVLIILVLVSIQGVIFLIQNRNAKSQEVSKVGNDKKEEILADATEELTEDEKIAKIKKLSESWDENIVNTENVNLYNAEELNEDGREQVQVPIPIPNGYVLSGLDDEKTIGDGVVIYEGTGEVTEDNKDEAQRNRNQWVWVPIYDVDEIYGVDSSGQMHGKLYNYSKNDEGKRKPYNWSEGEGGVMAISNPTSYREPDLATYHDIDNILPEYLLEEEREELEKELTTNFEKTINSIKKYGGFYIGRYETGGLSGDVKVVKQNEDISDQTWYVMYEKSKKLGEDNDGVETSLIWGCLWDATLQWLINTNAVTYNQVGSDSTVWGNYRYANFKYENSQGQNVEKRLKSYIKIPTGSSVHNKKNNIYDMAGNVFEWTLEVDSYPGRILRGGYYHDYGNGSNDQAHSRESSYPINSGGAGARLALFVALSPDSNE